MKKEKYKTNLNFKIGDLDENIYIKSSFMVLGEKSKKGETVVDIKDIKKNGKSKSKSTLF